MEGYQASTKAIATGDSRSTADITVRTQDGVYSATAAGNGPIHALHLCLRKCLSSVYPQMADVRLTDYKVRVLEPRKGTAAKYGAGLASWTIDADVMCTGAPTAPLISASASAEQSTTGVTTGKLAGCAAALAASARPRLTLRPYHNVYPASWRNLKNT